jgi:hypothetical protein
MYKAKSFSRFLGWFSIITDPYTWLQDSNPFVPIKPPSPHAEAAILQLGNLFLFCAIVQIACCHVSKEPIISNIYLGAAIVFDLGHVYGVYRGLGWDRFVDFGNWNGAIRTNVAMTMFLFLARIAYVLGLFGSNGRAKAGVKQR